MSRRRSASNVCQAGLRPLLGEFAKGNHHDRPVRPRLLRVLARQPQGFRSGRNARMARSVRRHGRGRRPRARDLSAAPAARSCAQAPRSAAAGAQHALSQQRRPRRPAAVSGQFDVEQRLSAIVRWNALAMVVRANRAHPELGGHIASYASAADLFEVGFNHFFAPGRRRENRRSRRGPGLFPAALGDRRLLARVSRRAPERSAARALSARDRRRRARGTAGERGQPRPRSTGAGTVVLSRTPG